MSKRTAKRKHQETYTKELQIVSHRHDADILKVMLKSQRTVFKVKLSEVSVHGTCVIDCAGVQALSEATAPSQDFMGRMFKAIWVLKRHARDAKVCVSVYLQ